MTDGSEDPIAEWAKGLTPEGDPGEMSTTMRKILGDEGYERAVAQHDLLTDLHMSRQHLINRILLLIVVYGVVFGAVAVAALFVLLLRTIFG